jgi:cyclopropane-fatty-acyl-phospholipid synthase
MQHDSTPQKSTGAHLADQTKLPKDVQRVFKLLERLPMGSLKLTGPKGQIYQFGNDRAPHVELTVHDWVIFSETLQAGDIGFSQGYMRGDWETPDLTALLSFLIMNREAVERAVYGHWLGRAWYTFKHWLNENTIKKSVENIQSHYDLGNNFYALWLDESMNYSSALFESQGGESLFEAQQAKMRRVLTMAGVQVGASQRILEIGFGWGALAEMGAKEFGAQMTGITLSLEQLDFAKKRLAAQGLQADFRLQDYREIPAHEQFDAVCSVEMMEAVGKAYWPSYFKAIHHHLKPGGLACIQTIVIADELFERYQKGTDFIQQYIFPGGFLPSPTTFRENAKEAGFEVMDEHAFGLSYAKTLKLWHETFDARLNQVKALGFDDVFCRKWAFYLSYCEAAFTQGNTNVIQFTLKKKT